MIGFRSQKTGFKHASNLLYRVLGQWWSVTSTRRNLSEVWNLQSEISRPSERPGVMLLLTVLITGAVALTVSIHLALRGIGELDMGFGGSQAQKAFAIAEGCLEEALFTLSRDPSYTGGELRFSEGACAIEVRGDGAERAVLVRGAIDRWVRKVEAKVDISTPSVTLLDWKELP